MQQQIRRVLIIVWKDKWEAIVAAIGLIISIVEGGPLWVSITLGLMCIVFAFDTGYYARRIWRLTQRKNMPLLLIIDPNDDKQRATIKAVRATMEPLGFHEPLYLSEWGVEREDWVTRRERMLLGEQEDWQQLVSTFKGKINRMEATLEGQRIYHLFFRGPASLAIGMGAAVGTMQQMVIYHYQRNAHADADYYPVIDFSTNNPQQIRARLPLDSLQMLTHDPLPNNPTPELYLSVQLSQHSPKAKVEPLAATAGYDFIHIGNGYHNQLPLVHRGINGIPVLTSPSTGSGYVRTGNLLPLPCTRPIVAHRGP